MKSDDITKREKEIENLKKAIDALGWNIIIPMDYDKKSIPGLIIGEKYFIKYILDNLENNPNNKIFKSSDKKNDDDSDPTWH